MINEENIKCNFDFNSHFVLQNTKGKDDLDVEIKRLTPPIRLY
jgi:hypothetical protein